MLNILNRYEDQFNKTESLEDVDADILYLRNYFFKEFAELNENELKLFNKRTHYGEIPDTLI